MTSGAMKPDQLQKAVLLMMAGAGMMGGMCKPNQKFYRIPIEKPKSKKYDANQPDK